MSEFGKGFAYCLGLFLAHADRVREYKTYGERNGMLGQPASWFYGAADHILEMEIPDNCPEEMKNEVAQFINRCVHWRLPIDPPYPTWDDVSWAIQTAKDILLKWDIHCGIPAEKGDHE
jgi:hypothetical protein